MRSLKLKSLKSSLLIVIILLIVGAVLLYTAVPSMLLLVKGPTPLESVDYDGDIEGLYVEGTLTFIYDWYCETTENSVKTVSREYIIDGGDYYYMGLLAEGKDMDKADALLDACTEYMDGTDDGSNLLTAMYTVKGTIVEMPKDSLEFYYEYVGYDDLTEEEQAIFLPYYLAVGNVGKHDLATAIALTVFGALAVFGGLFFLIRALSGKEQKNIYKYINASADPEIAKEKVERFLETVPEVEKLRYNSEFILGDSNGTTAFGETSRLVWAYQHTTTHKRYFITVGKTYSLMLAFADGSRQTAAVKSELAAQQHLEKLAALCPRAIIGYTEQLDNLFRNNLPGFLDLRYNRPDTYEPAYSEPETYDPQ